MERERDSSSIPGLASLQKEASYSHTYGILFRRQQDIGVYSLCGVSSQSKLKDAFDVLIKQTPIHKGNIH